MIENNKKMIHVVEDRLEIFTLENTSHVEVPLTPPLTIIFSE
jgi:hypothetical protein